MKIGWQYRQSLKLMQNKQAFSYFFWSTLYSDTKAYSFKIS